MEPNERLIVLMEEAGGVVQACAKALRFEYDEETNREALEREIGDFLGVVYGMEEAGDIKCDWRRGAVVAWSAKQENF